jgi:hypothetical protein
VIRALRRWLLGVEPDGPPLQADPLYHWEVRRYWTWRRYAGTAGVLLAWWALAGVLLLSATRGSWRSSEDALIVLAVLGRVPLEFMAAISNALAVVPERASGELEQLVLTPLDPWRLCRVRYAARMSGILVLWGLVGAALIVFAPLVVSVLATVAAGPARADDSGMDWLVLGLILAAFHLDWGLMLLIDGANGLRFSTTAKSPASAAIRSLLRSFLTVPIMLALAAISGEIMGMVLGVVLGRKEPSWIWVAGAVVFRLGLGLIILRDDLVRARSGTERIFFAAEEPA